VVSSGAEVRLWWLTGPILLPNLQNQARPGPPTPCIVVYSKTGRPVGCAGPSRTLRQWPRPACGRPRAYLGLRPAVHDGVELRRFARPLDPLRELRDVPLPPPPAQRGLHQHQDAQPVAGGRRTLQRLPRLRREQAPQDHVGPLRHGRREAPRAHGLHLRLAARRKQPAQVAVGGARALQGEALPLPRALEAEQADHGGGGHGACRNKDTESERKRRARGWSSQNVLLYVLVLPATRVMRFQTKARTGRTSGSATVRDRTSATGALQDVAEREVGRASRLVGRPATSLAAFNKPCRPTLLSRPPRHWFSPLLLSLPFLDYFFDFLGQESGRTEILL
jgi:hypothetical protein